jgi:hypothetical protein
MVEEQQHGFAFEKWGVELAKHLYEIRTNKPPEGKIGYTDEWDLPATLNPNPSDGPISIKVAKWNSSIGFGDARRQFQIDQTFTLVVGFWEQDGLRKRVVKIVPVVIKPELWASLWTPIQLADLKKLDEQIKDRTLNYVEARRLANVTVNAPPFTDSIFSANRKIDSKDQRRLQCTLTQKNFLDYLAPNISRDKEGAPTLWGHAIPPFLPGRPRFGAD